MKYNKTMKGVTTSLVAITLMMIGIQPSYAAIGGSSAGGGQPPSVAGAPQPAPNVAPPAAQGKDTGAANETYYDYYASANTWACSDFKNPDAIASWSLYHRTTGYGSSQADGTTPPDNSGTWTFSNSYLPDGRSIWTQVTQLGAGCVYKPKFVKVFGGYCVVSSTATVDMTAPTRKTLVAKTVDTPWGNGDHTIAGCDASRTGSVAVNAATAQEGQYHAYGVSQVDVLWLKHYVSADLLGRAVPDEVLGYAPAAAQGKFNVIGTQNCSGWHPNVLLPYGDATQCSNQGGKTPTFTCAVGGTPLMDIRASATAREHMSNFGSGVTQFMKDGVTRRIDFTGGKGAPTLKGAAVSNVTGQGTTFSFGNFPWMAGVQAGKNATDFTRVAGGYNLISSYDAKTATGKSTFMSGTHWNDVAANFYDASLPGTTVSITPKWTFTVDVTSSSIVINSIDPNAGTWVTSPSTTTNRENASCNGNTAKAQVLRAIGDVITGK